MPEEGIAAANWALTKLIKQMGEARTIVIRLSTVKHQEKLRLVFAFMLLSGSVSPTHAMTCP